MADPLHLLDAAHVRGLLERLRLTRLLGRFEERLVWAAFMFINGFITIAILAATAMATRIPFIFPSLGPTAFLLFFTPNAPTASPRSTSRMRGSGRVGGPGIGRPSATSKMP